jgi:outer membrane lipoprotein carrier protein
MPGSLACILSYGLTCAPATVAADPETPTEAAPETPTATPVATDGTPPAQGSASFVLAKVQSFYDGTTDLQAKFKQTYVHPVYGTKKVTNGKLRVRKPGYMVWDYDEASNADFWVEGDIVYVVESATKQVLRNDLRDSDVAGAEKFLFGGNELTEDFLVKMAGDTLAKRYGQPGHTSIRLKPKKANAHYKELMLVVDDGTGRVDAFVVLNQDTSTNHFELSGLDRNQALPEASFKFKKPSGYTQVQN